jgi:DNA polymerase-3 subunit delta
LLYILYGEDDFSLKEELNRIRDSLGDKELIASSTEELTGLHLTLEQLITVCDTLPFLAPKRLVIVEGLLTRFEPQEKDKRVARPKDSEWQSFTDYVRRMPESTVLVLIDGRLKKSNPMLAALESVGQVKEFNPLRKGGLKAWIVSRVNRMGSDISPRAVSLLAELVGGNLWLLSREIDKLCIYTQGRKIEEKDVRLLVSHAQETRVFDMVDAILERKTDTAIKALHRLESEGAATPYLLFMITRQLRMVIQAKEALQKCSSSLDRYTADISSDYALKKARQQAAHHSMEDLKRTYCKLLESDVAIKTGRFKGDGGELALDLLVCELCEGK